jgi:hypothetical protein
MTLEGLWYNESGSTMEIINLGDNGLIQGKYKSSVGDAKSWYSLTGFVDPLSSQGSQTIGFVVLWSNAQHGDSHAVTTWSGQYQIDKGEEVIHTTWLLTSATIVSADWQSTLVGQDSFSRTQPSEAEIVKRKKSKGLSTR